MSDGYSDEDFEDYSEDEFEDDEESPKPPPRPPAAPARPPSPPVPTASLNLPDAIALENRVARASSPGSRPSSGQRPSSAGRWRSSTPPRPPNGFHMPEVAQVEPEPGPPRKSILPSRDQLQSDAQIEALSKNKARQDAIMAEISLEVTGVDNMFDAMPVSVYDLMGMGRGAFANMAIATTQTNDDSRETEVQTEEIEYSTARCQAPEDLGVSREELEAARTGKRRQPARSLVEATLQADSERKLSSFVRSVGRLILQLLGEGSQDTNVSPWTNAGSSSSSLSSSAIRLVDTSFGVRRVAAVAFSQEAVPRLLVGLCPATDRSVLEDHGLGTRGMLCVWDLHQPQRPTHQLICEGAPTCCCWAAGSETYLAFAGMEDGGVCLWDLREPGMRFPAEEIEGRDVSSLRRPTYSTEFLSPDSQVPGGTVALAAVPRSKRIGEGRRSKGNLQLLSCGVWGDVTLWSVNEMSDAQVEGTAEVDFGLRVGGRVRLLRMSAMLRLGLDAARPAHLMPGLTVQLTNDICLLPRDTNQFIVGSDGGRVLSGARYGEPPAPKEFKLQDSGLLPLGSVLHRSAAIPYVSSVHFSPFLRKCFAAGFSNGTIAVFTTLSSLPRKVWDEALPGGVRKIRWSPARPGVLYGLGVGSSLYVFDLSSANPESPVKVETLPGGEVTTFEVISDASSETDASTIEDGWISPGAGHSSSPSRGCKAELCFAVGYADGHSEVHLLSPEWTEHRQDEYFAVSNLLGLKG